LLNLCKVILRVLVENEFPNGTKWELAMWPDLCEIEDVVAEVFCLLRGHGLDVNSPSREFAVLDVFEERLSGIIRVLTGKLESLIIRQRLNPTSVN